SSPVVSAACKNNARIASLRTRMELGLLEMRATQKTAAIALLALLGLTGYGLYRTMDGPKVSAPHGKDKRALAAPLVDQTPFKNALQLAALAATEEESSLSKEALRLADYDVDLAYDAALSEARKHPPALSEEAKEAKERLQ